MPGDTKKTVVIEDGPQLSVIRAINNEKNNLDPTLPLQQRVERLKAFAEKQLANHQDITPEEFNSQLKAANPDYVPPQNPLIRRAAMTMARENYAKALVMQEMTPPGSEGLNVSGPREWYSVMGKDDKPETRAENEQIVRIINSGTDEERHELFLSVLQRLCQVDVERIASMNDRDIAMKYPELIPSMIIASERENLASRFKSLNCGITPEEESMFKTIAEPIYSLYAHVNGVMDRITNPYYPEVDNTQIPGRFKLTKGNGNVLTEGYAMGYGNPASSDMDQSYAVQLRSGMEKLLEQIAPNTRQSDYYFSDKPDFRDFDADTDEEEYGIGGATRDLHAGRPVYMIAISDFENGNLDNIRPIQDFHGRGKLTVLPNKEKEPNGFQRFFDRLLKMFGGRGLEACSRYDRYVARMNQLRSAEPGPAFPDRPAQVEAAERMLFPGLDDNGKKLYHSAVKRTAELQKAKNSLEGSKKELGERCIAARQELTRMVRSPEFDPDTARKLMSVVLAATAAAAIERPLKAAELDNAAEAVRSSEVFRNAAANLTKYDLVDFLGGRKQMQIENELANRQVDPNAPRVDRAPASREATQTQQTLVGP